jgi:hypothetical protein
MSLEKWLVLKIGNGNCIQAREIILSRTDRIGGVARKGSSDVAQHFSEKAMRHVGSSSHLMKRRTPICAGS